MTTLTLALNALFAQGDVPPLPTSFTAEDLKNWAMRALVAMVVVSLQRWWANSGAATKLASVTTTLVAKVDDLDNHAHEILKQYPGIVEAARVNGYDLAAICDEIRDRFEDAIKIATTAAKVETTLAPIVDAFKEKKKTDAERAAVDEHGNAVPPAGGTNP